MVTWTRVPNELQLVTPRTQHVTGGGEEGGRRPPRGGRGPEERPGARGQGPHLPPSPAAQRDAVAAS
jgi:hypothetical protein